MVATMKVVPQEYIEEFAVSALAEHPDNPNRGDDEAVGELIDANGFYGAIVVQRSSRLIIAGNTRYRAAVAAGAHTMPVLLIDVDDEEAQRIMLGDNAARDKADYDDTVLASLLEQLAASDRGLAGTGYQPEDLSDLLNMLATPSLDELGDRHGEHDPTDLWPVLRFKVSPAVRDRYLELVADVPGGDADQFAWMLERAETSSTSVKRRHAKASTPS